MEDLPQLDTGKRKRSPADSLVDVPIPFPYHGSEKSTEDSSVNSSVSLPESYPLPKRPRLPAKPSIPESGSVPTSALVSLPPGVLQAIFSYLDPPTLGHLMLVNRYCRDLLDSRYALPSDQTFCYSHKGRTYETDVFSSHYQDAIWTTSRRRHAPSMPQPMKEMSEREAFALAFGLKCQFCGVSSSSVTQEVQGTSQSVPAVSNVRVLWPFRVRSCMQCLTPRLKKVTFDSLLRLPPF